jgi:hypothetical protein
MLVRRSEVTFRVEQLKAKITNIKPSKDKRFMAIEILKEH